MEFLESLQSSAFGMWVAGGETIWAYPTIAMHRQGAPQFDVNPG